VEDPNTTHEILEKFSVFEIVIVWELNFVKIMKMSKNLNNKDSNMSMKSSYHESLTHAHQIWLSYSRPTPNLDGFLCHSEKYKLIFLLFVWFISVLEINLRTFLILFFVSLYSNSRRHWSLCSTSNPPQNAWVLCFF